MGAEREVARVCRETLSACLTCPLCRGLLREATAIAECLHTFCRECIMKEINDEDVDHCPVCNIDLGCEPEEKLRPDHNLQDIRNKLFPIKREKVASSKGSTAILPAKRKERSLSSLVVDSPRVGIKAGMTGKRTNATRRRTGSHAPAPNKNGTMNLSIQSESQDQMTEKHTAPQSTKVVATANKKQRNADVEAPKKPSSKDRKNSKTIDKEEFWKPLNSSVDAANRTKSPRSSPKVRAVKEQVIKNKEGFVRKKNKEGGLAIRKGDTYSKSRFNDENKGSASEPASLKGKTRAEDNVMQEPLDAACTNTLCGAVASPVWFSLVSLPNENEGPQLPQLPKSYLRIKDGSLQISSVQKYIMTKLDLASADEVQITCQGEPICPSSTLQGLVELCVRREQEELTQASLDAPAKEFVMVLGYRHRQPAPTT